MHSEGLQAGGGPRQVGLPPGFHLLYTKDNQYILKGWRPAEARIKYGLHRASICFTKKTIYFEGLEACGGPRDPGAYNTK